MKKQQLERFLVRRPCVAIMREYELRGLFDHWDFFYWDCGPDMGFLTPAQRRNAKLDGLEAGRFDLLVIASKDGLVKNYLVEYKYGKNNYTTEQKYYAKKADKTPIETLKIYSPQEFHDFLKELMPPKEG